ncbi:MAG: DNA-binding protein [Patescibacteria group bacterium]|nr:DNA-binding protein [Patescibacteria group bacterium]MDE1944196.1 DNA-binding protein [Patescibacteria group bacterium]MDE1945415.1 DNA-binding protein [Patescibacteria group bacterium]MDE2057921.1 DNA-binding protein [Patescibacteria group bacterium]
MRIVAAEAGKWVLNLERGEELFATLLGWAAQEGIQSATCTGLGAADRLELAYYHLGEKRYERHEVGEEVEILSLVGNLGELRGAQLLHIHGTFGRRDLSTFGGHLFSLRVSGACEIHLTTFNTPFRRAHDEATGLNLLRAAQ